MQARRRKRDDPPKSNRGRPDARGVLIIFDEPVKPDAPAQAAREALRPARAANGRWVKTA
jgi:hypothetical protein